MDIEKLAYSVIGSSIEVHRHLGPGLLESTYETCLCWELQGKGIEIQRQVKLPISYKKRRLSDAYRLDILIESSIILELKTVDKILPIYEAQLLTYLKLSKLALGFILNFNVPVMKNGIKRFIV